MTNSSTQLTKYHEYISSADWRAKRQARLELDGHCCRLCDHDGSEWRLEVHHRPSSYARIPNESVENDLITLCKRCHDVVTSAIRSDRYGGRKYDVVFIEQVEIKEIVNHGMENKEVSIDWHNPVAHAQRPARRARKQVVAFDEGDYIEAKQNGRGL